MKRFLLFLMLLGSAWGEGCYLKQTPFLKLETGVYGGIAFRRDTVLLVIPTSQGRAAVWLDDHGTFRTGTLPDYNALASEVAQVYELKSYEPFMGNLDPYGLRISVHAHDGEQCFAYSPQRDCSVRGDSLALPSQVEMSKFREICARLRALESQATSATTREQFQAAELLLWKS